MSRRCKDFIQISNETFLFNRLSIVEEPNYYFKSKAENMATRPVYLISEGLYPQSKKPDEDLIRLAMGIFTQAVRDLTSPQKKIEKDWEVWQIDAQEWFDSSDTGKGSFLWVCVIIGAEPNLIRQWVRGLQRLDRKTLKGTILSLVRLTYLRSKTDS